MKTIATLLLLLGSFTWVAAHNRPELKGHARSIDELDKISKDAKTIKLLLTVETSGELLKTAVARFPQLDFLSIYYLNRVSQGNEVSEFSKLSKLSKLEFMGDYGPSDKVVMEIAKLKKLDSLRIYFNND